MAMRTYKPEELIFYIDDEKRCFHIINKVSKRSIVAIKFTTITALASKLFDMGYLKVVKQNDGKIKVVINDDYKSEKSDFDFKSKEEV